MKRFLVALVCLLSMLLPACRGQAVDDDKATLLLPPMQVRYIELEVGERSEEIYVSVDAAGDASLFWNVRCVSENEKVARTRYERTESGIYIFYTVEGVSSGETHIYFCSADGSIRSEMIRVRVIEKKSTTEPIEETTSTAPETDPIPIPDIEDGDRIVYVTETGARYHYRESHAGAYAIPTTKLEAIMDGMTPCKICAKDEPKTSETVPPDDPDPVETDPPKTEPPEPDYVYVTSSGTAYHYSASHAGKNAFEVTLEEAIALGRTPCGICVK